jgi:alkylation response protein AidB-like acyl-CoA dehydrogenase
MGGALVLEDGTARRTSGGAAETRMLLFPRRDAILHDTWSVSGLRGTGSHDMEVRDLFVPATRSVSLQDDTPRERGPLYALPVFGFLAVGVCAVGLGIARASIETLQDLAAAKTPTGSRRLLGDRALVQSAVAQAEGALRAARAGLREALAGVRDAAPRGVGPRERALLRIAATHAARTSARVVDAMYEAGGGSSVYAASPLQRQFRDVHVMTQHASVAPPTLELAGRVLLGLEADLSLL